MPPPAIAIPTCDVARYVKERSALMLQTPPILACRLSGGQSGRCESLQGSGRAMQENRPSHERVEQAGAVSVHFHDAPACHRFQQVTRHA